MAKKSPANKLRRTRKKNYSKRRRAFRRRYKRDHWLERSREKGFFKRFKTDSELHRQEILEQEAYLDFLE